MYCHHPPMTFRKWFQEPVQTRLAPAGRDCLSFDDDPGPEGIFLFRPSRIRQLKEKYTFVLRDMMNGDKTPRQAPTRISSKLQKFVKSESSTKKGVNGKIYYFSDIYYKTLSF